MQLEGDRKSLFLFSSPFFLHGLSFYLKRQRNQYFPLVWSFYLCSVSLVLAFRAFTLYTMATKVKGIYKYITNIFVVKERELEIGGPTDVKHVAHIGWEGPSGGAPTWMKSFKAGPEFAVTSIGNSDSAISPWSSQGCGETTRQLTTANIYKDMKSTSDVSSPPKKHKRRKPKSTSSPKSSSPSTLRSSRATKHKAKSVEGNRTPTAIEVS